MDESNTSTGPDSVSQWKAQLELESAIRERSELRRDLEQFIWRTAYEKTYMRYVGYDDPVGHAVASANKEVLRFRELKVDI